MIVRRILALSFFAAAVAGCSNDGTRPSDEVLSLVQQGGDDQSAPAGAVLADPLQVGVKDATGNPVRGAEVLFSVVQGSGAVLTDSVVTSDLAGIARAGVRLGPNQGQYLFKAFLEASPDEMVTFRATATPPPTLVSASKTTVQAGDTIVLTGTNFNTTVGGNVVLFGLARGRVLNGATPTSLDVIVPPCIAPGSIAVSVRVGSAATNSLNLTFSATPGGTQLALLEAITIAGTELGTCLQLQGDGADYLVVPQFATGSVPLASVQYTLGSQGSLAQLMAASTIRPTSGANYNRVQALFDLELRRLEGQLASTAGRGGPASDIGGQALEAITLNSTRRFRVLSSLDPADLTFKSVTGRAKVVGTNIVLYVDVNAPAGFSDAQLQSFGRLFDNDLYPIGVNAFGTESDIDRNGKLIVLLTPVVNELTEAASCGPDGFVTGFFFGFDLQTNANSNSNKAEIFYALVPDTQGQFSCQHSVSAVAGIVPSTFIHEFQHMISYNQHVLVRGGNVESIWLNEGLSHIAEELASRHYENKFPPPSGRTNPNQVFPDSSQSFILGNLFNSYKYLSTPDLNSVTLFSANGTLADRGAAWLFLRWLGDQTDSTVYGRLVQTRKTGIENLEEEAGETFASLFGDFSLALYTDSIVGVPRTSVVQRYRFSSRNLRFIYDALYRALLQNGQPNPSIPRPFPIVLKTLPYNSFVPGSIVPGTMDFFRLQTPNPSSGIGLQFSAPGTGPFPANLNAQVGVFRLPQAP